MIGRRFGQSGGQTKGPASLKQIEGFLRGWSRATMQDTRKHKHPKKLKDHYFTAAHVEPQPEGVPLVLSDKQKAFREYRHYKAIGRLDEWRRRWQFVLGFRVDR